MAVFSHPVSALSRTGRVRYGCDPANRMPWLYLAAAAGVLLLVRIVFALVTASERVVARAEERRENQSLRERLDQFTR